MSACRRRNKGPGSTSDVDDVVAPRGQSAERPVDDTAESEDDMDEVSTEHEDKRRRTWRQNEWFMQWPVVLGVLVLLVVLSVLGILVYILYTNNANLTSRFQELERKTLVDIVQLQNNIISLESRSSDLKSVVEKMDENVPKLVADVEKLDLTFMKLKPKVDKVNETVVKLEPKVEKMDETVVILEPKIKTLDDIAATLEPKVGKLDEIVVKWEPTIKKIDKTVVKLKPKVEKLDYTVVSLEPKVETLDKTVAKLEPKVEKIEETIDKLEPKVEKSYQMVPKLAPKVEKLDETVVKLEPKVQKLEETIGKLGLKFEKIDDIVVELEPKVRKIDETVVKLDPKIEEMDKAVDKLEPTVGKLDKTVLYMEPKVNDLNETVGKLDGRVQNLNNKVSGTEINALRESVTELRQHLDNLGTYAWKKLPESQNRIDNLELTSYSQYSYIYLLLLMTVGLTLWSLYSYSQMPGMKNALVNQQYEFTSQSGDQAPSVHEESYRVGSVLDSIQRSTLARQICVVSFYSETKAFHMRLVESACSGELSKVDKVGSLVSNHETIPKLPRAKIFLVFVDFNERNIILEHPDREIGDLRMTTVQGARKMGGDVFVVYVKDKGSRNLNPDHLYNESLKKIITHPELSVLSGKQRVLTTYEEFTTFQCTHLAKSFMRTLKR
ncbi:uncharacterized protein LOC110465672 isoform X2 [Mizuhopecten yessoensis]|uniref:uncharacterized protein LOC110465672 isoform X2 n=1 Tax=Mizuhopecten yessoensis TaxID=6573 RepID=UPI000B45E143|nr:uncharacterized protein LOC110465672 isoform X2 [Mizuhopecten yessoensis]